MKPKNKTCTGVLADVVNTEPVSRYTATGAEKKALYISVMVDFSVTAE